MKIVFNNGGSPYKQKDDCTARAIAVLTGEPYDESNFTHEFILPKHGFRVEYSTNIERTISREAPEILFPYYLFSPKKDYFVSVQCPKHIPAIAGHCFAIIKGEIHDMYDPRFCWYHGDDGHTTWTPIDKQEGVLKGNNKIMEVWSRPTD